MNRFLFTLLFSFTFIFSSYGEGYFKFTPSAKRAYEKAMELRIDESSVILAQIKRDEPGNMIAYFIENYLDFMRVFINEQEAEFDILEKNKRRRLEMIRKGDPDSPYYLYTQAEIKLQWALLRLKFKEYLTALGEIKSAYKLLNKNLEKHPDFLASKKSLGVLHALVGTIPDSYKWAFKILSGMDGTIEQGRQEIEDVLNYAKQTEFIFEEETLVLYAFLMLHLKNEKEEAWKVIQSGNLNPAKSPLACFAISNMAMRIGKNDEAIQYLKNRPKGYRYLPLHFLDFMMGVAKLRRLDVDADVYLLRFLKNFKGANYIKEAYQKLAWHYLLHGNEIKYEKYMALCKSKGNDTSSGDKSALREAKLKIIPNVILLRARVLFDGGYYTKAFSTLKAKSIDSFLTKSLQLEYIYRLARIAHLMKNHNEALMFYQQTIDEGKNEPDYFACNAALKAGELHEFQGNINQAKTYYKVCLKINPDEYKHSIHGLAKAGLNRLK